MATAKISYHIQNSRSILHALKLRWQPRLPLADLYAFYALSHSHKMPVTEETCAKARQLEGAWGTPLIADEWISPDGVLKICELTASGERLLKYVKSILYQALEAERYAQIYEEEGV